MVALKGNPNIGDLINKKVINPIETPLSKQTAEVSELGKRVAAHLEKMGFAL